MPEDFPDWDPIPQLSVAFGASGSVTDNGTSTLVDPTATGAVRLWTASLYCLNTSSTLSATAVLKTDAGALLMQVACKLCSSPSGQEAESDSLYFGGVVLPKGAKVQLEQLGPAGSLVAIAQAVITYTLVTS